MGIRAIRVASLLAVALLLPALVHAQSQFTGQVRDESGAVLPGVLVEASSPALIEKSKTAVTDEQGRYTIVDLRPGVYRVTFTLTGFSTIVRRRGGAAVEFRRDDQRRHEARLARRDDHRFGSGADGRCDTGLENAMS